MLKHLMKQSKEMPKIGQSELINRSGSQKPAADSRRLQEVLHSVLTQ